MAKEDNVETVTMSDGRLVDFTGKRRLNIDSSIDEDGQITMLLDWRNGETRKFQPRKDMNGKAAGHGYEQKLRDETAGENDIDDAVLAVDSLIDRLNAGEWNMKREAGGMSGTSVLLKALVEYTKKTVEEIKALLSSLSHQEKMALRGYNEAPNADGNTLKAIVDRLEAEKQARVPKADVSAIFAKARIAVPQ